MSIFSNITSSLNNVVSNAVSVGSTITSLPNNILSNVGSTANNLLNNAANTVSSISNVFTSSKASGVSFNVWGNGSINPSRPINTDAPTYVIATAKAIRADFVGAGSPISFIGIDKFYKPAPTPRLNHPGGCYITHGWRNTGGNAGNGYQPADWMANEAQALRQRESNANIILVD